MVRRGATIERDNDRTAALAARIEESPDAVLIKMLFKRSALTLPVTAQQRHLEELEGRVKALEASERP